MEKDPSIMPKIDLFPRVTRVVHFLFDHLHSEGLSDHANRGGAPALDRALYDEQAQIDFEAQSDKGW